MPLISLTLSGARKLQFTAFGLARLAAYNVAMRPEGNRIALRLDVKGIIMVVGKFESFKQDCNTTAGLLPICSCPV